MSKNKIIILCCFAFVGIVTIKSFIARKRITEKKSDQVGNLVLCRVKNLDRSFDFTVDGEVMSNQNSEIKSLVNSSVKKILVKKNSYVKKNQKLLILDDNGLSEECLSHKSLLEIEKKKFQTTKQMYLEKNRILRYISKCII